MGDTSFVKYNHRILSINKGNTPDVLTESITVPSFRGYSAGEVIPAGTKLIDIINKEFKSSAPTHTVTITVVGSGTTSPAAGSHSVIEGNSFTMTSATPASGWNLDSVKLDGASVTLPYVIPNVTGDKTFVVTFAEPAPTPKYTITTSANAGGTITPTFEVEEGQQANVVITPNSDYQIKSITKDGSPVGIISPTVSQTVMIADVHEPHTVNAEFEEIPPVPVEKYHVVIADATSGLSNYGTISPAVGTHDVEVGQSQAVTATPASGFKIKSFKVDGTEQAISDPTQAFTHTVSGAAADATVNIIVEFERIPSGAVYNQAYTPGNGRVWQEPTAELVVVGSPMADPDTAVTQIKAGTFAWKSTLQSKSAETFLIAKTLARITSIKANGTDEVLDHAVFDEKSLTIDGVDYWCYYNKGLGGGGNNYVMKGE